MSRIYYKVGGHTYCISTHDTDLTEALLSSSKPFAIDADESTDTMFTLDIEEGWNDDVAGKEIGQFDCGGCNHGVYISDDGSYLIVISDVRGYECCRLYSDANFSKIKVNLRGEMPQLSFGLNNALMISYAFAAADRQTVLMHASVVRKDERGYLCLGVSGTGKSTHTSLWLKHIPGTDLMNDDNPVVRVCEDGTPMVYGSPWSGKTPCYRNVQAPIGGFLQLKQAPYNKICKQGVVESYASLLTSCSFMNWDKRCSKGICDTIGKILQRVPTYLLECLPDEAACQLSYSTLSH